MTEERSPSLPPRPRGSRLAALDLGLMEPISAQTLGRALDRRTLSVRWLAAIVMTGAVGALLIGVSLFGATGPMLRSLDQPHFMLAGHGPAAAFDSPGRGDRLVRAADIASESRSFKASAVVSYGDTKLVQVRSYTHVATTLALAPTSAARQVPSPGDAGVQSDAAHVAPQPTGTDARDHAEASFRMVDMADADPGMMAGSLTPADVQAQLQQFDRMGGRSSAGLVPTSEPHAGPAQEEGPGADLPPTGSPDAPGVRIVEQNVSTIPRSDASQGTTERLVVLRRGEMLEEVLRTNGASPEQARSIAAAFGSRRGYPAVGAGQRLRLSFEPDEGTGAARITKLSAYSNDTLESVVALADDGGYVKIATSAPQPKPQEAAEDGSEMRVYDSLYQTALRLKIPKTVIGELVRVFGRDVDLQGAVAAGDTFDAFYGDGDDGSGNPVLLYASISLGGEAFRYHRFRNPGDGSIGFYDEDGRFTLKLLMRSPVPRARLTSLYGMRFHPILGYARPHTGVDWGAPMGTPILAAGDGTVIKARRESAYGNRVELQHADGYTTTYSHMEGFGPGITDGATVKQGQTVGYLGQTGLATGPHLHYEVLVNGRFVDPMKVKLTETRELAGRALQAFKAARDTIDGLLADAGNGLATDQRHAAN